MTIRPQSHLNARRWKIGSARPYLTLTKDGRTFTIHEKALLFDTPRVVPGIAGSPYQRTIFAMANIEPNEGLVRITAHGGGKTRTDELMFRPFAAHLYEIPEMIDGVLVEQVEMYSTVHISGYQFAENKKSGFITIQHLEKEGN